MSDRFKERELLQDARARLVDPHWHLRPAVSSDAHDVGTRLRRLDQQEIWAVGRRPGPEAIADSMSRSEFLWCLEYRGRPTLVGGVGTADDNPQIGVPWLLGTDDVQETGSVFLRVWEPFRKLLFLPGYDRLFNMVAAFNRPSTALVRRLGFTVHPAIPFGPDGTPFHPFDLERIT